MKKIILSILSILFVFSIVSCGTRLDNDNIGQYITVSVTHQLSNFDEDYERYNSIEFSGNVSSIVDDVEYKDAHVTIDISVEYYGELISLTEIVYLNDNGEGSFETKVFRYDNNSLIRIEKFVTDYKELEYEIVGAGGKVLN